MSNSCPNCVKLQEEVTRLGTDTLTGLAGRGVFERALQTEFARCRRFGRSLGIIMIDVDRFKAVNDAHGHLAGDQVLARVARRVAKHTRDCDTVARYGGEEFVILTDGATLDGLWTISERLRLAVKEVSVADEIRVTISLGFSVQAEHDKDGWAIIARADTALYRAKRHGRDRAQGE